MKNLSILLCWVLLLTACNTAQQAEQESQLDNKIKCNEYGMKNFYEENNRNLTHYEQKFAYSPSLDTCLYYDHYSIRGTDEKMIKDMISGKGIAYYHVNTCFKEKDCSESQKEDDRQMLKLFMDKYDKYFE